MKRDHARVHGLSAQTNEATPMPDTLDPLVRDLVEWIAREPRRYGDVLDAWRTSCPRLTVWEEALERGLVERRYDAADGQMIAVTDAGLAFLAMRTLNRTGAMVSAPAPSARG